MEEEDGGGGREGYRYYEGRPNNKSYLHFLQVCMMVVVVVSPQSLVVVVRSM